MRTVTRRVKRVIAFAVPLVLLGLAVLIAFEFRWGAVVVLRKSIGMLPEVSWADLANITRSGSHFYLRPLARSGNPYTSVANPYVENEDGRRGEQLFAYHCTRCHGPDAKGGLGPALVDRSFTHGDSDWAVYRTITQGVPGTAMQGGFIEGADVWRVIGYLRRLDQSRSAQPESAPGAAEVARDAAPEVPYPRLLQSSSGTGEWLLPGGSYDGRRFARDTQINVGNVARLNVNWVHQFSATEWLKDGSNQSVPVVVGDYMYVTVSSGGVYALDPRSGEQIWRYSRPVPADFRSCCLPANRGVAVLGRRVYFGTMDAHLIALDSTTGKVQWDQKVEEYTAGYSITSAPLPINDLIITGVAGGEFPTRGFIAAYDAATGALRWRFKTIPEPGEPGHETWGGESWKTGGAPTWGAGTYDPELGLLYWGVGAAAPDFAASLRPGDNLYSNSLIALNAATGKLIWYFQFLPADDHDWDSIQTPSLIDVRDNGGDEKLLGVANRGGFFYLLDRRTGRFIHGAPFVQQTWAVGLSSSGRPIRAANSSPSVHGTLLRPSWYGATNWWPSAFSPQTGLYYVDAEEGAGLFLLNSLVKPKPGLRYTGGEGSLSDFSSWVKAIDPLTGAVRWERRNSTTSFAPRGGLLATAGGLLFGSDGTRLYALDAASGRELWSFNTGGHISAAPMSFELSGRQFIAVVAGQDVVTFALPPP